MTPRDGSTTVGLVLKGLRLASGLTQESLAERAGLHTTYISLVERGRRNPTFGSLSKIIAACDATWEEFGREIDQRLDREGVGGQDG